MAAWRKSEQSRWWNLLSVGQQNYLVLEAGVRAPRGGHFPFACLFVFLVDYLGSSVTPMVLRTIYVSLLCFAPRLRPNTHTPVSTPDNLYEFHVTDEKA